VDAGNACNLQQIAGLPDGWHSGGWNYVYADSHVKFQRPTNTIGKGVGGNGMDAAGNVCGNRFPCGPWTVNDSD